MIEEFPFQKAHDAIVSMLHDYLAEKEHAERLESENAILMKRTALLMEEVERLTKAGDAMAEEMGLETYAEEHFKQQKEFLKAWEAAKEGKQP